MASITSIRGWTTWGGGDWVSQLAPSPWWLLFPPLADITRLLQYCRLLDNNTIKNLFLVSPSPAVSVLMSKVSLYHRMFKNWGIYPVSKGTS